MLHAVTQRKAKLSVFKAAGERVPLEDLVTSTIFGSLTFLRYQERAFALSRLWAGLGLQPLSDDQDLSIDFWPKMPVSVAGFRVRYIEPDVTITDPAGSVVLVEVKWGAPLSPMELSSQWLALDAQRRKKASHFLLVQEPNRYLSAIAQCRSALEKAGHSDWKLETRSWREFGDACRKLTIDPAADAGVRTWARLVHAFLRREIPGSMLGWDNLDLLPMPSMKVRGIRALPMACPPAVEWSVQ